MSISVFDPTPCTLGEGPLWHPGLNCLFWFDILGKRLFQHQGGTTRHWQFDEEVSAAGWLDDDSLLIAGATRLFRFSLSSEEQETLTPLEADNPDTRSNDGRADPLGGFWIGTMNRDESDGGGAIYRYYKGELRELFTAISIPNATCFDPDGRHAFFTDTPTGIVQKVALDRDGWPEGAPETFLDLTGEGLNPDGAVTDGAGNLWVALYGSGQVRGYAANGAALEVIDIPAANTTCPALGGRDFDQLFCTTAGQGDDGPAAGQTFVIAAPTKGRAEPRVVL